MGSQKEMVWWRKGESLAWREGVRHASWHWALNVGHIVFEKDSLIHSCRQSLCYSYQGTFISIFLYVIIPEYGCPLVTAGDWFLYPLVIPNRDAQVPHILIKRPRTAGPLFSCIPHSQPTVQRASYCLWVTKSCQTLCNPVNCSTPAFPVLHCLPGVPGPIVVLIKEIILSALIFIVLKQVIPIKNWSYYLATDMLN